MERVNYHLTAEQLAWLRERSKATGLSVAELIRRAIDEARDRDTKARRRAEK